MFGGSFAFAETLFPTASQEDEAPQISQDVLVASNNRRELQGGILTLNIALIKKLYDNGSFRSGICDAYEKEWQFAAVVGFITELDIDTEKVWIGRLDDGTGTLNFRYEESTEYEQGYAEDMANISPDQENRKRAQLPSRLIGLPQVIDGELCLMASFARPATASEYVALHQLEAVAVFVQHGMDTLGAKQSTGPSRVARKAKTAADPYNDEPIVVDNADTSDLLGTERLARVIWKYLKDEPSDSVMTAAVRSFCQSKWNTTEVTSKLDELEEAGVLMYLDSSKSRVQLVE